MRGTLRPSIPGFASVHEDVSGRASAGQDEHLAESRQVDRRLANRNIRTALIVGALCMLVFASSFLVAFVY